MATLRVLVQTCDRCQSEAEVVRLRVVKTASGRTFSFDACGDCYNTTPLSEWESLRGGRRRVRRTVVDPAKASKEKR